MVAPLQWAAPCARPARALLLGVGVGAAREGRAHAAALLGARHAAPQHAAAPARPPTLLPPAPRPRAHSTHTTPAPTQHPRLRRGRFNSGEAAVAEAKAQAEERDKELHGVHAKVIVSFFCVELYCVICIIILYNLRNYTRYYLH